MRKVFVKEIHELTELETDCLLANHDVQQEILEHANEMEAYWLDEIFYCISDSLSDYRIEEAFNSYIKVKDYQEFYEGIMRMEYCYEVFSATDIIERIENVFTVYDTVYSDGFIKCMEIICRDIAVVLGGYANWYSSYKELEYETDFILTWLEGNYDKECIVDGGSVTLLNY